MSTGQDTRFSCTCGALTGHIANLSPESAVHALCFCPDCRAAEVYLGQPDPGTGGVDLAQLNPSDISIDTGQEHLALLRLYPTGLFRWYAACCNTPLFNTVTTPKVRLASIRTQRLDEPNRVGPVRSRAFVTKPNGKRKHEHVMRLVWPLAVRSLAGLITGEWRDTPFFDPTTRQPVCEPKVLTREERRALGLGPKTAGA